MQFSTKASVDVGMSIGMAVARKDGEAPDELLRKADYALYLGRGEGRGSFALFVLGNERKDLIWIPPTDAAMERFSAGV